METNSHKYMKPGVEVLLVSLNANEIDVKKIILHLEGICKEATKVFGVMADDPLNEVLAALEVPDEKISRQRCFNLPKAGKASLAAEDCLALIHDEMRGHGKKRIVAITYPEIIKLLIDCWPDPDLTVGSGESGTYIFAMQNSAVAGGIEELESME